MATHSTTYLHPPANYIFHSQQTADSYQALQQAILSQDSQLHKLYNQESSLDDKIQSLLRQKANDATKYYTRD